MRPIIPKCNFTPISNIFFEYWLNRIGDKEFKILMYILSEIFKTKEKKLKISTFDLAYRFQIMPIHIENAIEFFIKNKLLIKTEYINESKYELEIFSKGESNE